MAIRVEGLSRHTGVLILLLVELLAPAGVSGQEALVPLQFSFSDPGARSMGFGGAFVALADDATAATTQRTSRPPGDRGPTQPGISSGKSDYFFSTARDAHKRY